MKKILFMIVMAFVGMVAANAQTNQGAEYDRLLEECVDIQGMEGMMVDVFNSSFQEIVRNGVISQEKCDALSRELVSLMLPEVKETLMNVYRQNFNLEELREVVKWNTSPLGKKMMALVSDTSTMTQRAMENPAFQQRMMEIISKYVGE